MPVFQEQGSDGYRFIIRPNCALSWRITKLVLLFFSGCLVVVAAYFAALGAWLVLPFAGLELLVLAAGFYLNALAGHTREVIEIEGPVLAGLARSAVPGGGGRPSGQLGPGRAAARPSRLVPEPSPPVLSRQGYRGGRDLGRGGT